MPDDKNIKELPVKFKKRPSEDVFMEVVHSKCAHGRYELDKTLESVTCKRCGEKMNPMYVLSEMASRETAWHRARSSYQEEMERLKARRRTKCEHCKKMTDISGR